MVTKKYIPQLYGSILQAFYQESVFDDGAYVVTVEINSSLPCARYLRRQANQANLIVPERMSTTKNSTHNIDDGSL